MLEVSWRSVLLTAWFLLVWVLRALVPTHAMEVHQAGAAWRLTFQPNQENVGLVLITECKGREPFYAYDRFDIPPTASQAWMRRQPTPKGARCTVVAWVVRNASDDPQQEYASESSLVITIES